MPAAGALLRSSAMQTATVNAEGIARKPTVARKPPFRAEHVGSLLRPAAVLAARKDAEAGRISRAALRRIEDHTIRRLVKRQQDIGLEVATDGEIRRGTWHMDFLCQIGGVTARGIQRRPFRNETGDVLNEIVIPKVTDRLHLERTIFGEDFVFLKAHTAAVPKLTIPSPNMLYGLGEVENPDVYPDIELELRDLVDVYAEQMRRLELLGCRYLQIDDTTFATLGHAIFRNEGTAGARTADTPLSTFIGLMNAVLERKPPSMTVCVHTCRGNHRSAWIASGGYDAVAEAVFNELKVDGFFLEYDDARSGSFEPLRFVPKDKTIVLGLVTTKSGRLESKDDLKRRVDEAARYVPLDQLCLSPQCGFASTLQGNLLTEDEQFAKLGLMVETAREI